MSLDDYILSHIDDEGDYLRALYRDTHLKLLYPRMASGHLQGRLLKMFVRMIRPAQVLEIGTYSGYSALCMAEGLPEGGMIHTFEINDEQEDFTRPWLERSAYAGKIKFYIGDALEQVPRLGLTFDLAYVDGDKRRYVDYYEMVLQHLAPGGYILDSEIARGRTSPRRADLGHTGLQRPGGEGRPCGESHPPPARRADDYPEKIICAGVCGQFKRILYLCPSFVPHGSPRRGRG